MPVVREVVGKGAGAGGERRRGRCRGGGRRRGRWHQLGNLCNTGLLYGLTDLRSGLSVSDRESPVSPRSQARQWPGVAITSRGDLRLFRWSRYPGHAAPLQRTQMALWAVGCRWLLSLLVPEAGLSACPIRPVRQPDPPHWDPSAASENHPHWVRARADPRVRLGEGSGRMWRIASALRREERA